MIKSGDTIGILALGGNCDEAMLQVAVNNLENYGYKIKLAKNIYDKSDYLAGSDEDKLKELYNFFSDSEIAEFRALMEAINSSRVGGRAACLRCDLPHGTHVVKMSVGQKDGRKLFILAAHLL